MNDITAELWDETDSELVEVLDTSWDREVKDAVTNLGTGSLTLPNYTTAEQATVAQLTAGRHIRYKYRGRTPISQRIDTSSRSTGTTPGEARKTVTTADKRVVLSHPTVKAAFADNPKVLVESRPFNCFCPEYDDSGWDDATVVQTVTSWSWEIPNTDPPWFEPWTPPKGWASLHTPVIQCRTGVEMPAGSWPARKTFADLAAGWYMIQLAAFDRCELYLQGVKFAESGGEPQDGWQVPLEVVFYWHGGDLVVGILVERYDNAAVTAPGTLGNFRKRSLTALALFELPDGASTIVTPDLKIGHTDDEWKVLDFPGSLPAPTAGVIMDTLVTEAKADKTLGSYVTVGFTGEDDSNENSWVPTGGVTFADTDDYNDVVNQFREMGFWFRFSDEGYTLEGFNPASPGTGVPVEVSGVTVHDVEEPPNQLLVKWERSRFLYPGSDTLTSIRREVLELGHVTSAQEALIAAAARMEQIEARGSRMDATVELVGADEGGLYDGWRPGGWITVPGEGDVFVESVTLSENDAGNAQCRVELSSPGQVTEQRLGERLARVAPGSGAARSASIKWVDNGFSAGFVQEESISPFSQGEVVTETEDAERGRSTAHVFDVPTRISLIRITAVGAPTESQGIQVEVRKNGVAIEPTLFLPEDTHHAVYLPDGLVFMPNDELTVATTETSDGAGLLSVQFHAGVAQPGVVRPQKTLSWL